MRVEPVRPMGSIIKAMASKKSDAFAGYGRHCINDFLYQLAIFPGTPSYIICRSEERYQEFKTHLHEYMTWYSTDEFLNDAASIPNTGNPFTFNERSHRTYTSRYIDVFRRASKRVPREIYNQHVRQGLLDKTHTIGKLFLWLHFILGLNISVQAYHILKISRRNFASLTVRPKQLMFTLSREELRHIHSSGPRGLRAGMTAKRHQ